LTRCIQIPVCPSRRRIVVAVAVLTVELDSGRYFSFPSFDLYEANQQDEEKEGEAKSP
jgi:hypothetical protein